jgi:hypothetical protein
VQGARRRRDGIPNVVVEAMAMGVPCAGTQAAGLEEIIAHGETGTLTAPNDPEAMAEVLAPLLREPSTIDAMGPTRGREWRATSTKPRTSSVWRRCSTVRSLAPGGNERSAGRRIGGVMSRMREVEPMRVLHVIEAIASGRRGVAARRARCCAAPGVEVLIVALNRGGPSLDQAAAAGARTFVLGGRGAPLTRVRALAALIRRRASIW